MSNADPHWHFTNGATLRVGTLYCIGRNYAEHAKEMNAEVPADPIVFLKPPTAYRKSGSVVSLPSWTKNVHHEVECVVVVGADADQVSEEHAWDLVAGIAVGLDLTARDIQTEAKRLGSPWAVAKAWSGSAPVSNVVPLETAGHGPWQLQCSVNGSVTQNDTTNNMERSVPQLIRFIANVFGLRAGDAIFTGTPAGVGPVSAGDVVQCSLSSIAELTVRFA